MFRVLAGFRSTSLTGLITLWPAIFVVQFQESLYKIAIFCQEKYWSGQVRSVGQGMGKISPKAKLQQISSRLKGTMQGSERARRESKAAGRLPGFVKAGEFPGQMATERSLLSMSFLYRRVPLGGLMIVL